MTVPRARKPAIPPTLRRLERAAMRAFSVKLKNHAGNVKWLRAASYSPSGRELVSACASHAAWKAKQRREKA